MHKTPVFLVTAALALCSFILMCYFDLHKIYSHRVLFFGAPAFFIVLFFILSENRIHADNIVHRFLYRIGNASYVVYLCHPFCYLLYHQVNKAASACELVFLNIGTGINAFFCYISKRPGPQKNGIASS